MRIYSWPTKVSIVLVRAHSFLYLNILSSLKNLKVVAIFLLDYLNHKFTSLINPMGFWGFGVLGFWTAFLFEIR